MLKFYVFLYYLAYGQQYNCTSNSNLLKAVAICHLWNVCNLDGLYMSEGQPTPYPISINLLLLPNQTWILTWATQFEPNVWGSWVKPVVVLAHVTPGSIVYEEGRMKLPWMIWEKHWWRRRQQKWQQNLCPKILESSAWILFFHSIMLRAMSSEALSYLS